MANHARAGSDDLPARMEARERWQRDTDWAILEQEPLRARTAVRTSAVVIVLLLAWPRWRRSMK